MIVNHFNTFPYGGAAAAANRIHQALLRQGIDSRFLYEKCEREPLVSNAEKIAWETRSPAGSIERFWDRRRIKRIRQLYDTHLAERDSNLELFSMCELTDGRSLESQKFAGQIIHLHWLAFMADYPAFFGSIGNDTPVVWTLHDMNPMTGGCHYSNGCHRFEFGCGECPQVLSPGRNDISNQGYRIKEKSLRKVDLTIAAPSEWILNLAKSSPIFPETTRFELIRLGFDLDELRPVDKKSARQQLDAPTDRFVIGFGAESISNRRKGFDLLLQALARLQCKAEVECFVFGSGEIDNSSGELPSMTNFGFIDCPGTLNQFYSACDVVVVPSREDNQPQVGLEAMACGTPVIGFDVGGIGEYVRVGETGWLAEPESHEDLSVQIEQAFGSFHSRQQMAAQCRTMMENEFDIRKQSRMYADLYDELLSVDSVATGKSASWF